MSICACCQAFPDTAPAALVALRDWQMISVGWWLVGLVLYLLYFAIAQFKSSVFVGQSGAEIHLARHKKIVDTIRAGELRVVLDPRVYPLAVVSTKYFLLPAAQVDAMMREYFAYSKLLTDRGANLGGEALQPATTATTLRMKDGAIVTTDGPFAETKEALGGFYLIEAKDLDEALELAAKCPGVRFGAIEVRPIREMPSDRAAENGSTVSATS